MKTTKGILIILFVLTGLLVTAFNVGAQNSKENKEDKEAAKRVVTQNMIDSQNFIFVPQSISPSRGGSHILTTYYDLRVSKDSIVSYLPYFGRAYSVPYNSSDDGFNFISTNFDYKVTPGKKSSWDISIKPKDNMNGQQLLLNVFDNATASLTVTDVNRDPISYQGYIMPKKQKN